MARRRSQNPTEKDRISVSISEADRQLLKANAAAIAGSEAGLAEVILHEGLKRVGELVKARLDAVDTTKKSGASSNPADPPA